MARFLLRLMIDMPWIPRLLAPNLCYHVRIQCNNRAFRFSTENDFERYFAIVTETKQKFSFHLHHCTLMHTHVHLIITTPGPALLDRIMHRINQRYAVDYHQRYHRYGHFWINGYRSSVIDTDRYALTCMRYLDRNAPRAGLVTRPEDWPWCSYRFYAYGEPMPLLDAHPSYLGLAETPEQRQKMYREFVESLLPSDERRDRDIIQAALQRYAAHRTRTKR